MLFAREQLIEPFAFTELEILVHLDRLKRTNLDTNLTTHANRDVDVEDSRIKLRFAEVIRFFVFALNNINALRRTFFLANLARDAAQSRVRIASVISQEREIPVIFRKRTPLLRILHRDQALFVEIAACEISQRDRHSLQYSRPNH